MLNSNFRECKHGLEQTMIHWFFYKTFLGVHLCDRVSKSNSKPSGKPPMHWGLKFDTLVGSRSTPIHLILGYRLYCGSVAKFSAPTNPGCFPTGLLIFKGVLRVVHFEINYRPLANRRWVRVSNSRATCKIPSAIGMTSEQTVLT